MASRSEFVSVGVERRYARLTSLRALVPQDAAIVGIDLAGCDSYYGYDAALRPCCGH